MLAKAAAQSNAAADEGASGSQGASSKPLQRTKFRRRKPADTLFDSGDADASLKRLRNRKKHDIEMPDGKWDVNGMDPIILVDGYNIVGFWPKLRKYRDRGELSLARDTLAEETNEFANVRGWDCEIVFDANATRDPMKSSQFSDKVDIVYTGTEDADSFIERRVYELCEADERQVWVATNDTSERRFAESKGAHVMSASLFVQEMKRARKESRERAKETSQLSKYAGNMLIRSVSNETRAKLYQLRDKIDGSA